MHSFLRTNMSINLELIFRNKIAQQFLIHLMIYESKFHSQKWKHFAIFFLPNLKYQKLHLLIL